MDQDSLKVEMLQQLSNLAESRLKNPTLLRRQLALHALTRKRMTSLWKWMNDETRRALWALPGSPEEAPKRWRIFKETLGERMQAAMKKREVNELQSQEGKLYKFSCCNRILDQENKPAIVKESDLKEWIEESAGLSNALKLAPPQSFIRAAPHRFRYSLRDNDGELQEGDWYYFNTDEIDEWLQRVHDQFAQAERENRTGRPDESKEVEKNKELKRRLKSLKALMKERSKVMMHMNKKGGTDVERNLNAIDNSRETRKLLADDDSLSDDDAEFTRLSAPSYPRGQLEMRASSHARSSKCPERSEKRRDMAMEIRQTLDAQREAGAEQRFQEMTQRLARDAKERATSRADKMKNVMLSNAMEAMKNNDQPSVILLRKWGAKSWLVIYNVPRYDERWRGRECSTFRVAHVEMLSREMLDQGYDIRNFKPGTRCVLDSLYEGEIEDKGYQTIAWKSKELDAIEPPMRRHFTVYCGRKMYNLSLIHI